MALGLNQNQVLIVTLFINPATCALCCCYTFSHLEYWDAHIYCWELSEVFKKAIKITKYGGKVTAQGPRYHCMYNTRFDEHRKFLHIASITVDINSPLLLLVAVAWWVRAEHNCDDVESLKMIIHWLWSCKRIASCNTNSGSEIKKLLINYWPSLHLVSRGYNEFIQHSFVWSRFLVHCCPSLTVWRLNFRLVHVKLAHHNIPWRWKINSVWWANILKIFWSMDNAVASVAVWLASTAQGKVEYRCRLANFAWASLEYILH